VVLQSIRNASDLEVLFTLVLLLTIWSSWLDLLSLHLAVGINMIEEHNRVPETGVLVVDEVVDGF